MKLPFTRTTALVSLAALAGVASAVGAGRTVADADAPHARFAAGHLDNAIRLAPDDQTEIHLGDAGAALRFHMKNQFPRAAMVRYATELTDELGHPMTAPITSPPIEMEAEAETSFEIDIPSRVRQGSGFYLFRVTAAGRAGDDIADETMEIGLAVLDGTGHRLDAEQWLEFSLANLGEAG